jgi:hypothetical protein
MPDEPLEIYSDVFRYTVTPYGVNITFGLNAPHPAPAQAPTSQDQAIVRMSLEQAKVMAMMLRRNLKAYERENGLEIALPPGLYTQLGIAREDWGDGGTP